VEGDCLGLDYREQCQHTIMVAHEAEVR
jgi:hypothetical protein